MTHKRTAVRVGLVGLLVAGALTATQTSASADPQPSSTDVVGVGSDVIQNTMDFLADGFNGDAGYNTAGNKNRLISFDATADGNGRNAFTDPSLSTSVALNPTVVLRAGTSPVQRPNGGSAGLTALLADGTGANALISFVRSPNLPTAAQQATEQGKPVPDLLHTVQFAKDDQVIATASTTNAPAALSAQELVGIYSGTITTWNQVPGNSTGSTDTIIPLIPQTGAGVRTIFLNALKAANGGTAITLGGSVRSVQQNDPTTITGLSATDQKNAIVPFPVSRYDLLSSGYFLNPNTAYSSTSPAAPLTTAGIALQQGGTPGDSNATFDATIPYYVIFRESDFASSTPWQPGSTLSWVQTLFSNPGGQTPPFVDSGPGQALISAAHLTPLYADLGNQTNG